MLYYWLVAAVVVAILYCTFLKQRFRYWEERGVPYLQPHMIYGNIKEQIVYKVPEHEHVRNLYNKFSSKPFFGMFKFQRPEFIIRDPELIKQILIKDFTYFYDRSTSNVLQDKDKLSYHLFHLSGKRWRALRFKLSPTFTSGKMKMLFQLMKQCAISLDVVTGKSIEEGSSTIGIEDLLARYLVDVIGSCVFGLQINSLENPDNKFRNMSNLILGNNFRNKVFLLLTIICPWLLRVPGINYTPKNLEKYFINTISDTVKYRDKNNVKRHDFLDLLMSLRDSPIQVTEGEKEEEEEKMEFESAPDKLEMTMPVIAAQCFAFLIAGFEISSATLCPCLMELAMHEDIQEKVRQEIDRVWAENGNDWTYDGLNSMHYTDKVICETMRKYTSSSALLRVCTKPYRIPNTKVVIDKGTDVSIPIYALHHDPQYYSNPDEFNPENFSEENRNSRPPFTYLPFGEGPRVCIGKRFGLMQVKLGLITLVKKYKFSVSSKMITPPQLVQKSFLLAIKGGVWLDFSER